jgi:acetaldehyde dehydrogenase/alcohol dehydrogenase
MASISNEKSLETNQTELSTEYKQELFPQVDEILIKSRRAAAVFTQYSQEQVDKIVYAVARVALSHSREFAKLAAEETKMGVFEDKVLKNLVASEFLYYQIKDKKTVGVIKENIEDQMVEVAEPVGVIAALTPVTNPTSTVIYKILITLKTRNAIVFSPHLMSSKCVAHTAEVLYKAAIEAGAPEGCIAWLKRNSKLRVQTEYLMHHPEVDLVFATGGTSMVKVAYSSGKPALGVGSGNTPVYIHKSADIESTAMDICISKTFDNGNECPSEQTLVIDKEIYEETLEEFRKLNCHICSKEEIKKLTPVVIDPQTGSMNYRFVGKEASKIAEAAQIEVCKDVKILMCEIDPSDINHPLLKEKLMPVLAVMKAESENEALNKCLLVNHSGGTGHTSGIFANDESVILRFQDLINAGRVIVNQPTSLGGLGGIYNNLSTTLSFGCGTGGGNSTTENVNIYNLLNIKRVPRRQSTPMMVNVPNKIYFNPGSLSNLKNVSAKNVFILASKSSERNGSLQKVIENLSPTVKKYRVSTEVKAEPEIEAIKKIASEIKDSEIDLFIALGGGSVIDAAKVLRLYYEAPEISFEELSVDFADFRKRAVNFPKLGKTKLIAIPTTSGTGSETSPASVITNKATNSKISLFDFSLTPDMAIVDGELVTSLPIHITTDTGIDALTHALEAFVSVFASDYTDGLCLEAIKSIFDVLPKVLKNPENVELRQTMHNAATLAGMAFSNASVGINHAMAHSLGAKFNIPHGRANSAYLLSTVTFNSGVPKKFMPFPTYRKYVARAKYAQVARLLGIDGSDEKELIEKFKLKLSAFLKACSMPTRVSELGIKLDEYLAYIPEMIEKVSTDLSIRSNPRMPMVEELGEVLKGAY